MEYRVRPMVAEQSTLPVFHLQSRNALELTPVVRHEDQSVTERDGSNLEIVRANDHSAKSVFPRTGLAAHAASQASNQRLGQKTREASRVRPPRLLVIGGN